MGQLICFLFVYCGMNKTLPDCNLIWTFDNVPLETLFQYQMSRVVWAWYLLLCYLHGVAKWTKKSIESELAESEMESDQARKQRLQGGRRSQGPAGTSITRREAGPGRVRAAEVKNENAQGDGD